MRSFLFLLISALALGAQAAPPPLVQLDWQLTKDGTAIAAISQKLQYAGGRYEIVESWKGRGFYRLLGTAKRTSRGEVLADGLRPLQYSDERTGRDTERASFDWRAKTATYQYKGAPVTIPLPAHPTDDLAALFGFAFRPPRDAVILQDVINGRGVSDRVFRAEGAQKVATPAGEFNALKLVRRKEGGERAEIWLAIDRDYLPVRILVVDKKGEQLDQVVTRISSQPGGF